LMVIGSRFETSNKRPSGLGGSEIEGMVMVGAGELSRVSCSRASEEGKWQ
jgi:hypothetical protein